MLNKFDKWVGKYINKAIANSNDFHNFKQVQWFGFGGKTKGRQTDEIFLEEGYATNNDLHAIIERLSQRTAEVPLSIRRTNNRDKTTEVTHGLMYDLFIGDFEESLFEKIYKACINLKATGDIFIEFKTSFGFSKEDQYGDEIPSSVVIHRSGMVTINNDMNNGVLDYTVSTVQGSYNVKPKYMLHTRLYDPTMFGLTTGRGLSRVQAAYRILHASNEIQTASASVYRNMGSSVLISDKNQGLADPDTAKALQTAVNGRVGGSEKAGMATITGADVTVHQLGMSSKDMELLKSQPMKLRQMCAMFGTNSLSYNDPEGTTFNNLREAKQETFINGVRPDLRLILDDINRFFRKWEKGVALTPDYTGIEELQADQKEEAEKSTIVSVGLQGLLIDTVLTPAQKILILVDVWKMTKEQAQNLVK